LFLELVAGKLTRLLVGARNNGSQNFIIESIDGSLRYPQDFSYYIQNFTSLRSEKVLESGLESTFEYLFMPSETFNGRPMGLVVLINYRNSVMKKIFSLFLLRFDFSLGRKTFSKCCFQSNN
jgi:translocon-associated protein subunit alpha